MEADTWTTGALSADRKEGRVAKAIESQTTKMPSDWFLWAAGASIVGAAILQMTSRKDAANFVGHWAPTILILGVYNKMVKRLGSD